MVRDLEDRSGHFLHIKEGLTQGGGLVMIAFDIVVQPPTQTLRGVHHCVTHAWYADNAGAEGKFD